MSGRVAWWRERGGSSTLVTFPWREKLGAPSGRREIEVEMPFLWVTTVVVLEGSSTLSSSLELCTTEEVAAATRKEAGTSLGRGAGAHFSTDVAGDAGEWTGDVRESLQDEWEEKRFGAGEAEDVEPEGDAEAAAGEKGRAFARLNEDEP
jgi:hypothetical protein